MKDNSDSFQDSTLKVYTKYKNDLVQQNHPATRKRNNILERYKANITFDANNMD